MSYQELKIEVWKLRQIAQGNDAIALKSLRFGAMQLHSALPILSPYLTQLEEVLIVTKSESPISQRLLLARKELATLDNDLTEAASYLAEKQVNREEDGSIVYA